jgi:ribosomal protein S18
VDYRDSNSCEVHDERGKIVPGRVTGANAKQQRRSARHPARAGDGLLP